MSIQRRKNRVGKNQHPALSHEIQPERRMPSPQQAHANRRETESVLHLSSCRQSDAVRPVLRWFVQQHHGQHFCNIVHARGKKTSPRVAIVLNAKWRNATIVGESKDMDIAD